MPTWLDNLMVAAAVGLALAYCGGRLVRRKRESKTGCVGSGCGCPAMSSLKPTNSPGQWQGFRASGEKGAEIKP